MDDSVRQELVALLPRLRRFAYGLTGSVEDGDDLLQSALVRAISRIDQWRPGTRLHSWMFRIMQTIRINDLKAVRVRAGSAVAIDPDRAIGGDLRPEVEGRLMLDAVRRGVARLPEEQRAVLLLVCVEGLSYKEVAEMIEIPVGTVMSRLARARGALHRMVDGTERSAEIIRFGRGGNDEAR